MGYYRSNDPTDSVKALKEDMAGNHMGFNGYLTVFSIIKELRKIDLDLMKLAPWVAGHFSELGRSLERELTNACCIQV